MEKTIAVVVTTNCGALLTDCINALRYQTHQPDTILVVNIGSTDEGGQWLHSQDDLVVISQDNAGTAMGFAKGIEWAFKNNFSWIWCMDDNGFPAEDALEKILQADTPILSLRNCAVLNIEDRSTFVWKTKRYKTIDAVKTKLIEGVGHPFNGTLLHRSIIERVGLPKPELFVLGVESEYYYRITQRNCIPVYTVTGSVHYHRPDIFNMKQDWDYTNTWQVYFYIRNRFHIYQSKFNYRLFGLLNYCWFLLVVTAKIIRYQKTQRFKKLRFLLWPVTDALFNDYNVTPECILASLSPGDENLATSSRHHLLRNVGALLGLALLPIRIDRVV